MAPAPVRRQRRNPSSSSGSSKNGHDSSSGTAANVVATTKKRMKRPPSSKIDDTTKKTNGKTSNRPWHYQSPWLLLSIVIVLVAVVALWQSGSTVHSSSPSNSMKESLSSTSSSIKTEQNSQRQRPHDITPIGPDYQLLETLPHDSSAFTQGLVYIDTTTTTTTTATDGGGGILYEGTGLHGASELRRVDIATGKVLQRHVLDRHYFGEGIAYYTVNSTTSSSSTTTTTTNEKEGRLLQLTWQERKAFVYDATTFQVLDEFTFTTTTNEGWGITYNPQTHEFIVSDGSEWLHIWDATTMQPVRQVQTTMTSNIRTKAPSSSSSGVDDDDTTNIRTIPVKHLNELEFDSHDGTILANVWYRDIIVRIDLATGHVVRIYDFSKLHTKRRPGEDCFNGIALITERPGELYVTGKKWPVMYRVKLLL